MRDVGGSSRIVVKRGCVLARLMSDIMSSISPISRMSSVGRVRIMAGRVGAGRKRERRVEMMPVPGLGAGAGLLMVAGGRSEVGKNASCWRRRLSGLAETGLTLGFV